MGVAVLLVGEVKKKEQEHVRTLHQRMVEMAVLDHSRHIHLAIQKLVRVTLKKYQKIL